MLFRRVEERGKPERVFSVMQNVAGETIYAGYPVVLNVDNPDGFSVSKPAAATLSLLVGFAVSNIVDDAFGKILVHGYTATASVMNDDSVAIAAGNILLPVDDKWYVERSGPSNGLSGLVYAAESYATGAVPAALAKKVYIRCL